MKSSDVMKYRSIWMGVAILWVMFGHMTYESKFAIVNLIHDAGYGGVDVFLLASGAGIYYSLKKNADYGEYMGRRFRRILPTYYIFLIVWVIIKKLTCGLNNMAIVGNIFCIQFFTGKEGCFNWYMSIIFLCYLIAPLLYKSFKKNVTLSASSFFTFIALLIISICFFNTGDLIMGISRIPVFFLGMMIGKACDEREDISVKKILFVTILMIAGFVFLYYVQGMEFWDAWNHGLLWYPFLLIAPGIAYLTSFIASFLETRARRKLNKSVEFPGFVSNINFFFVKIGEYSFEIYLWHVMLVELYRDYLIPVCDVPDRLAFWAIDYALTFVLAYTLKKIIQAMKRF